MLQGDEYGLYDCKSRRMRVRLLSCIVESRGGDIKQYGGEAFKPCSKLACRDMENEEALE